MLDPNRERRFTFVFCSSWYLTLVQFILVSVISRAEFSLRAEKRRIPMQTYALLALATLTTMGFSNASLGYLNYPTQVCTWIQCRSMRHTVVLGFIAGVNAFKFYNHGW